VVFAQHGLLTVDCKAPKCAILLSLNDNASITANNGGKGREHPDAEAHT